MALGLMQARMALPTGMQQAPMVDDSPEYQQTLQRIALAAAKALRQPSVVREIAAAVQSDDPASAIGNIAYDMTNALDERSGASIPEDVLPGAALTVLGLISEIADLDEPVVIDATKTMMVRLLQEAGADPQEMAQALKQVDIASMVKKAQSTLKGVASEESSEPEKTGPQEEDNETTGTAMQAGEAEQ